MKIYLDNRGMYLKNLHFEWKLLRLFLGKVVHFALQDQYQPLDTLFAKNLTIYSPDIAVLISSVPMKMTRFCRTD
jgi:hypothetical protein